MELNKCCLVKNNVGDFQTTQNESLQQATEKTKKKDKKKKEAAINAGKVANCYKILNCL